MGRVWTDAELKARVEGIKRVELRRGWGATLRIISCGWCCGDPERDTEQIVRCCESVVEQSYGDWEHSIYLDGWQKSVGECPVQHERLKIYASRIRLGTMAGFRTVMKVGRFPPSDPVCLLDMDDRLMDSTVLERVALEYQDASCWVTHGSYITRSGRPARFTGPYKPGERFRVAGWRASHLKTFRAGLFSHIKNTSLKGLDGRYLRVCSDLAIMFPLLEMAGHDRIRYIPDILYEYNDLNPFNDHKIAPEEQHRMERYLRKQAPYHRLEAY
jgi:hypothetical protein